MHHADWLAGMLHGRGGLTDWNNALKLGFDPGHEAYPEWLMSQVWAPQHCARTAVSASQLSVTMSLACHDCGMACTMRQMCAAATRSSVFAGWPSSSELS